MLGLHCQTGLCFPGISPNVDHGVMFRGGSLWSHGGLTGDIDCHGGLSGGSEGGLGDLHFRAKQLKILEHSMAWILHPGWHDENKARQTVLSPRCVPVKGF